MQRYCQQSKRLFRTHFWPPFKMSSSRLSICWRLLAHFRHTIMLWLIWDGSPVDKNFSRRALRTPTFSTISGKIPKKWILSIFLSTCLEGRGKNRQIRSFSSQQTKLKCINCVGCIFRTQQQQEHRYRHHLLTVQNSFLQKKHESIGRGVNTTRQCYV